MANRSTASVRTCFFGAAPDTGNLGVSALCYSVLEGLASRIPDLRQVVFDHGVGARGGELRRRNADPLRFDRLGAANTKRLWRPEALRRMDVLSKLGVTFDRCLRAMKVADAVLDISGGDSFSDIYGLNRFYTVATPKRVALRLGKPLILLPQTYGPFARDSVRRQAETIIRAATFAWARDQRSFASLKELLGDDFDPSTHRLGVDVAFLLETLCPEPMNTQPLDDWIDPASAAPIIGLNVSGLVYKAPELAASRFGLQCDYHQTLKQLCRRWLDETDARILLLPHVLAPKGHYESDTEACEMLASDLNDHSRQRVRVAPGIDDPRQMKWFISKCDWFCGTRMHSTIAALSSGVPCATLAYSGKAQGVFESCNQGDHVADMRTLSADEALNIVWRSWSERAAAKPILMEGLDRVLPIAREQMDLIAGSLAPDAACSSLNESEAEQAA